MLPHPESLHSVNYLTKEINRQQRVKQNERQCCVHWGDEVSEPCSGTSLPGKGLRSHFPRGRGFIFPARLFLPKAGFGWQMKEGVTMT